MQPTSMQSGEQPISSEGQSEDMGPWTGATEEPSSRTRYVCIMCIVAMSRLCTIESIVET